jgi:hypothetical protein
MKNLKAAWPKWLLDAVTPEKEKEIGHLRLGDPRRGDLRLGDLRLDDLRLGDLRLDDPRWGDLRLGDLRLGDVRLDDLYWQDYFDVLWRVPDEIAGLIAALKAGKVNGSCYEGACACLCGTIANLKHCNYQKIPGLVPDSSRPIEQLFLGIGVGSTPENNPWCAMAVRWAEIFQELSAAHKPYDPCECQMMPITVVSILVQDMEGDIGRAKGNL